MDRRIFDETKTKINMEKFQQNIKFLVWDLDEYSSRTLTEADKLSKDYKTEMTEYEVWVNRNYLKSSEIRLML